ncbi:MAG TPA: hypothetical protein VIK18_12380 [Pirellulales bacterium]
MCGKLNEATDKIVALEERLIALESAAPAATEAPTFFEVRDALNAVAEMTAKMFPMGFETIEQEDCEVVNDRHFTFVVRDAGDVDAMVSRFNEWHENLCGLAPGVRGMFRLSIDAQE